MDIELVNRLSNLTLYGYYEPSKDMVIVHFFNKDEDKSDVIAYLKRDMSWDVREIVSEKSQLLPDKELVEITHSSLGVHNKESKFDQFVRNALLKMFSGQQDETPLREKNKMFRILEDNRYDD